MQSIETKRLVLRPFTVEDRRDFQELSLDWQAARGVLANFYFHAAVW